MQKHSWIAAGAVALGLGLSALLAPVAWAQDKEVRPGEYWIGVQVQHPLPDLVRAQLSIPKDEGVLVEEVEPPTPAQGKLQKYDVIVKAATKPLRSVADLVIAVDAVKGGKLPLEVLRGGKSLQVEITPLKRPAEVPANPRADVLMVAPGMSYEALNKVVEEWRNRNLGERTLRLETMRPGWILRPGTPHQPPLPANLTVSVTKQGDQPAKIVVKQDDQKWEVTENELDKLPKDLRPHVERMLGHGLGWPVAEFLQQGHKMEVLPHVAPKGISKPHAERQIDEMRQQIEQLRKLLDELQAQIAAPVDKR
jgi:hypothetical protein